MEGFGGLLEKSSLGQPNPLLQIRNGGSEITHLETIKDILSCFEYVMGLLLNIVKSTLVGVGMSLEKTMSWLKLSDVS